MALRIKAGEVPFRPASPEEAAMVPMEEAMPMPEPEAEMPMDEMISPQEEGKVPQEIAVYRGPDQGPFSCGTCAFFRGDSCVIVSGHIDEGGICNNFTPHEQAAGPDMPEAEEPVMEDLPEQEPAPELPA